jgi:hypothetical protein
VRSAPLPASPFRTVADDQQLRLYETVVLANSKREAIAKGKALYDLNGLAEFSLGDSGEEPWHAQYLDREVRS